jgi:hypothetical protein
MMIRMGSAVARAIPLAILASAVWGGPTLPPPSGESAPTVNGPKPQVDSAPAADERVTQANAGGTSQQSVDLRKAKGLVSLRKDSGGNTQILNVEATGGTITQKQSGTGNIQTLNAGTTDNVPLPAATKR